jgi:hypothetical protein
VTNRSRSMPQRPEATCRNVRPSLTPGPAFQPYASSAKPRRPAQALTAQPWLSSTASILLQAGHGCRQDLQDYASDTLTHHSKEDYS